MSKAENKIRIIRDQPATVDFFSTHTNIASSIAKTIVDSPYVRMIGLLGPWGGGKSTVVHQLRDQLDEDDFLTFNYDAWVYQSEPVRRSFIEAVVGFLISKGVTDSRSWEDDLAELNGQKTKTTTKTIPNLTNNAFWILVSLLFVPPGLALLDLDVIKEAFGARTTLAGKWTLGVAVALILLPLLVIAFRYVISRPYRNCKGIKDFLKWNQSGDPSDDIRSIFLKRSIETNTATTIKSPEPTSIEFAKTFQKIMKLVDKKGLRPVIVIDNLDRIPVSDALAIWSTIRSFFLTPILQEDEDEKFPHPVVILPIDDSAIKRIFGGQEPSTDLEKSFLEKTFDVTFRVTPPVMSDWRAFLRQQLHFAFGDEADDDFVNQTARYFEEWKVSKVAQVTPREINKFVNSIATLSLQWEGEPGISRESISFFSAAYEQIAEDIIGFVKRQHQITPASNEWPVEIAAIYFGVPLNKAAQVLLEDDIEQAIIENDRETFRELSQIPGFQTTLNGKFRAIEESIASKQEAIKYLFNAANLLNAVDVNSDPWQNENWELLGEAFANRTRISVPRGNIDQPIDAILQNFSKDHIKEIRSSLFSSVGEDLLKSNANRRQAIVKVLSAFIEAADDAGDDLEEINLPLEESQVDELLGILTSFEKAHNVAKVLRAPITSNVVVSRLAQMASEEESRYNIDAILGVLLAEGSGGLLVETSDTGWQVLWDAAVGALRGHHGSTTVATRAAQTLVTLYGKIESASDSLLALQEQSILQTRADECYDGSQRKAYKLHLALLISSAQNFNHPPKIAWRSVLAVNSTLADDILMSLGKMHGPTRIHTVWDAYRHAYSARPLLEEVVNHAVENNALGRLYLQDILENLQQYSRTMRWSLRGKFVQTLQTYSKFYDRLENISLGTSAQELTEILAKREPQSKPRILSSLTKQVNSLAQDQWQEIIETRNKRFDAILSIAAHATIRFNKRSNAYDAMREAAPKAATVPSIARRWFSLIEFFTPQPKKELLGLLAERLVSEQTNGNLLKVLQLGGSLITQSSDIMDRPDAFLIILQRNLFRHAEGRDWIRENVSLIKKSVQNASSDTRQEFREGIQKLRSSKVASKRYWGDLMWGDLEKLLE